VPQAIAWLLSVPGASRTVLDMRVPYSRASLADVLGKAPEVYACPGGWLGGWVAGWWKWAAMLTFSVLARYCYSLAGKFTGLTPTESSCLSVLLPAACAFLHSENRLLGS